MKKTYILLVFFLILFNNIFAGGINIPPVEEEYEKLQPPSGEIAETEIITEEEETYYITSGDLLMIKLPDEEIFSEFKVNFDGYISIPRLGNYKAEGLTIQELEKTIFFDLPVYLRKMGNVEAEIKDKFKYVQVLGHVRDPGWVLIPENVGAQGVISAAGGSIDGSVLNDIKLYRKIYGLKSTQIKEILIDLYKFKVVGDLNILPRIKSKDRIVIPMTSRFGNVQRSLGAWTPPKEELETSTKGTIRVLGAVARPMFLEPIKDSNVLDLIISAGGYEENADLTNVTLLKKQKDGSYKHETINLENYIETRRFEEIPPIYSGELIYVPVKKRSFIQKAWTGTVGVLTDLALIITSVATVVALSR